MTDAKIISLCLLKAAEAALVVGGFDGTHLFAYGTT